MIDASLNIIILLIVTTGAAVEGYRRRHRKVTLKGTSVLLSYYAAGDLIPIKNGMLGNLHYTAIIGHSGSLIIQVVLPFSTQLHLVGIPKRKEVTQLYPAGENSILEKVDLEGDYNNYFTLYAEKGMQMDSRYALDPKAMVFTIDFCQSHNWEIVDNQLYFVQVGKNADNDPTSMTKDVEAFVTQIQPAIGKPLSDEALLDVSPYNKEYRQNLNCPICKTTLKNSGDYLSCINADGVLIKGGALSKLHSGTLKIPNAVIKKHRSPIEQIKCPSCGNAMEITKYNGGNTTIDSCLHCSYRWLDAGELSEEAVKK